VEVLTVARVGVEPDTGLHVLLISPMEISEKLSSDLDEIIDNVVGYDIAVRVVEIKGTITDYPLEDK